jgi:hypothetical protein
MMKKKEKKSEKPGETTNTPRNVTGGAQDENV